MDQLERMNITHYLTVITFILFSTGSPEVIGQPYPQDDFISPISKEIFLAGTFGELRSNHFHAGIDLKGGVGDPIFAAKEGFISRIKVQAGGYGNVIYIQHPNGYTTVYAHLDDFTQEVATFVKKRQYALKSFEIDVNPEASAFRIKKGQQIGTMGVSGRSYGPHLHFEIRNSRTQHPINPLLFGFDFQDESAPVFKKVKLYFFNAADETHDIKTIDVISVGNHYKLAQDTIFTAYSQLAISAEVYDYMNDGVNKNGIYRLTLEADSVIHQTEWKSFSFAESRYINAHIDYAEHNRHGHKMNRCHHLPGNELKLYSSVLEDGRIELPHNSTRRVRLFAEDANRNVAELSFYLCQTPMRDEIHHGTFQYHIRWNKPFEVKTENCEVRFPEKCFYQNVYFNLDEVDETISNNHSNYFHIGDAGIPAHRYFYIKLMGNVPYELRSKAFIGVCDAHGDITSYGGRWEGNWLVTRSKQLGDYCIFIDDVKPEIKPLLFQSDMTGLEKMSFMVKDNQEVGSGQKGVQYEVKVDGEWILFEHDAKNNTITHYFDDRLGPGGHSIEIRAWDNRGNEARYVERFER